MELKQTSILALFLSTLFFVAPATVLAGANSGFYIGGGVGSSTVAAKDVDPSGSDFDEKDSGYKAFLGFNFGVIPLIDLAVEAAYVDFGNPGGSANNGDPIDIEITGFTAFGLAGVNIGPIGVFAKAGFVDWDSDFSLGNNIGGSDSGTDSAYGVGARLQFDSLGIRAEYEAYDVGDLSDLYMLSASLVYIF